MNDLLFPDDPVFASMLDLVKRQYPDAPPALMRGGLTTIRQASQLLKEVETLFASYQLTQPRFIVLLLLYFSSLAGGDSPAVQTPASLAEHLRVRRATITGLLDRLERSGWIHREINPLDRRQLLISLSAAGRKRIARLLPTHLKRLERAFTALSSDEFSELLRLLNRLVTAFSSLNQEG